MWYYQKSNHLPQVCETVCHRYMKLYYRYSTHITGTECLCFINTVYLSYRYSKSVPDRYSLSVSHMYSMSVPQMCLTGTTFLWSHVQHIRVSLMCLTGTAFLCLTCASQTRYKSHAHKIA